MERLRKFHNLTPEKIKIFSYYAKLRQSVLRQMIDYLDKRGQAGPSADKDELNMGCYREDLEPQVRDAVLKLRRKGYSTCESGFFGFNGQCLRFQREHLNNFKFPEELVEKLKAGGVNISLGPNFVSFSCDKELSLDQLREIWEEIESTLPKVGEEVEPCSLPAAISFRQKQKI